jgi:MFS family permease
VIVDRVPKRRILLITQVAAMLLALLLAGLTFTGAVRVWHVILFAVGIGAVNAFDNPARQAFVVDMVGREDLSNAIALNSMIFNGARIIGPAVGGLLLAAVGAAWCFLLNGLSFIAVVLALLAMTLPPQTRQIRFESPWRQLADGLHYVGQQVEIRTLILQSLIFSVFGFTYSAVLPAYAEEVLHAGAAAYGAIQAVAGVGAVTAAFLIARYSGRVPRGGWLVTVALAFPLVLLAFAWTQRLPVALGLAFFLGIGFLSQYTLLNTLLQTRVEDAMRGRVMSLYTLTFNGFAPFGNLGMGAVAERWGLSPALSLFAAITLVLSAANLLGRNNVRTLK